MTRLEKIRSMTDEEIASKFLEKARSPMGDGGWMYDLICDYQGPCKYMTDEEFDERGCTDEEIISCILRYLCGEAEECFSL